MLATIFSYAFGIFMMGAIVALGAAMAVVSCNNDECAAYESEEACRHDEMMQRDRGM